MLRSWKLGSAFGIGIFVHPTFLLLPAWVFLSNWSVGPAGTALYLVLLTVFVFGCIILHELGHARMARHFGIPTRDITIYPIGGVARLERMSDRPWEEFWIALAGPVVNVMIAAGLGAPLMLLGLPMEGGIAGFVWQLALINIFLALFNLLPAFPMDGGRILRALLATRLGMMRATRLAAGVGLAFSVLFFIAALLLGAPGLMLLALCLVPLGQQEVEAVRRREVDRQHAEGGHASTPRYVRSWIEWRHGKPVHVISIDK